MFHAKDEFNTNGQTIVERNAYVVTGYGNGSRTVYRNVYENEDGVNYVRYDGSIMTVNSDRGILENCLWG